MVADIRHIKGGLISVIFEQKCIDYIEKLPFMVLYPNQNV